MKGQLVACRFRDLAAVNVISEGAELTLYLDRRNTDKLARALHAIARSIEGEPFPASTVGAVTVDAEVTS